LALGLEQAEELASGADQPPDLSLPPEHSRT
jgi:hypothetical protein